MRKLDDPSLTPVKTLFLIGLGTVLLSVFGYALLISAGNGLGALPFVLLWGLVLAAVVVIVAILPSLLVWHGLVRLFAALGARPWNAQTWACCVVTFLCSGVIVMLTGPFNSRIAIALAVLSIVAPTVITLILCKILIADRSGKLVK